MHGTCFTAHGCQVFLLKSNPQPSLICPDLINQATKPWCQHQVVKGCRWDRITTSAPRCPFSNRDPPAIVLLWTFNYWLPLVGDGLLAAPKWTCEDLQRLSLRLGFEAQRAPLALAQLPLQWLRLAFWRGKGRTCGHGSKPMGSNFGVGEFTTHFRTYFSGWIGMFTAGTIWVLTHSHVVS